MKKEAWIYAFIYSKLDNKLAVVRYFESWYLWLIGWRIEHWEWILDAFNRETQEEIWMTWLLDEYEYGFIGPSYEYKKSVNWELVHKIDVYILIKLEKAFELVFQEDKWELVWIDKDEYEEQISFDIFKAYFNENVYSKLN